MSTETESDIMCVTRRIGKVLKKYPDRVPVLLESPLLDEKKTRYIVPRDVSYASFITRVRSTIKVGHFEAIFSVVNNKMVPSGLSMGEIYDANRDDLSDDILKIVITKENTFG